MKIAVNTLEKGRILLKNIAMYLIAPAGKKWVFNLQAKVMLIFLVLALVPLVVIGWFSLQITEELIANMVIRQLENVAVDKVAILERWLDERKADLKVVTETSLLRSMDPELIAPYLELIRSNYGVYKRFAVFSVEGDIIFSSSGEDIFVKTISHKTDVVRDAPYISGITYEPKEKESSFYIAAPVFDADGLLAGTVYGSVGTNKIIFFILNVSLGETGECYLVDENGRFLAHKEPHRILTENISQSDSFKNIFQKRDSKKAYLDYRGIEVLGTSMNVGGTDWYIVVEQDREEAFQGMNTLRSIIYLTLLLCICSALMLAWLITYNIVNPIRSLSKNAGIIANSKFDKAVFKTRRNDEIGMLYRAFEEMSHKLRDRQNHLQEKVGIKEAELKETDLILKKTQRIAERSEKFAAMGRMGAAIAHEIRTPLTSLKLFLESANEQIRQTPEDEEDFQVAMKQIRRIESTINRFLDFTKPLDLVVSMINVASLIKDVQYMIRPLANRQECSIKSHVDGDLPEIFGDRKLLTEALVNLMVNSLEAINDHGLIYISVIVDHFENNDKEIPCVRIDIQDTGQGIADDQIEKLFEPFYTTKSSGTGLGLPLVLNTVRNHGGVIRVKSMVQKGTTFSLFLPVEFDRKLYESNGKDTAY